MSNQIERARTLRKRLTPEEVKLWVRLRALRPLGYHFRRQVPIGLYIVDFACLRHALAVEVDGWQHYTGSGVARDMVRDAFLRSKGLRVLRVSNWDVDRNLNGAIEAIVAAAEDPHPARKGAPPSPDGGGIRAAANPSPLRGGWPARRAGRVG